MRGILDSKAPNVYDLFSFYVIILVWSKSNLKLVNVYSSQKKKHPNRIPSYQSIPFMRLYVLKKCHSF